MSKYIVCPYCYNPLSQSNFAQEIVRCRDCKHYYEAENYHPSGNYVSRCCKYFDTYSDEVEPDGFCAWGERKDDGSNR